LATHKSLAKAKSLFALCTPRFQAVPCNEIISLSRTHWRSVGGFPTILFRVEHTPDTVEDIAFIVHELDAFHTITAFHSVGYLRMAAAPS
jgi:hypothetical protein